MLGTASRGLLLLTALLAIRTPLGAQSFREQATNAYRSGDYQAAAAFYEKSVAAALKVMKEDDLNLIERRAELGEAYRAAGRNEDAIKQLSYVWKRTRFDAENKRRWNAQEGTLALAYAEKLGRVYQSTGRYQDALLIFSTGLFDAQRSNHDGDALQFAALLAETQFVAKNDVEAANLAAQAFAMAEKLTASPVLQMRALAQLSSVCLRHNQLGLAKPMAQRALEIAKQHEPATSVVIAGYQTELAKVLLQTGALDEAEPLLREAQETILANYTEKTPQGTRLIDVLLAEADLHLKRNQPDKALTKARDAVEICRKKLPALDARTGRSLKKLADTEMALNRPVDAKPHYEQALMILEEVLGPDDPFTTETRAHVKQLSAAVVSPAASSASPVPGK
ncbi:MAG: tetratricopeptide repeat protein [Verrucomicrobia bacterium]|nr:tetratricopeptide repeat protein [Verrucomicrobiota bacterium]